MRIVRRSIVVGLSAVLLSSAAWAQPFVTPTTETPVTPGQFSGSWAYRSFRNNPDINATAVAFGRGTLVIVEAADHSITGTIGGPGWELAITGKATYSPGAALVELEGQGTINNELWVYDYAGWIAPKWSNGIGQLDAIVGSLVRTTPHDNGTAEAGYTASFYAVRID